MRVLILCYSLNNGGAERVAAIWANELAKIGHEVAVYYDQSQPQTYELAPAVTRFSSPRYAASGLWDKIRRSWRTALSLFSTIRAYRPDVVVNVMHSFMPELLAVRPLLPRFKFLSTEHNSFERPVCAPFSRYDRMKKFKYNKRYDAVTVLTAPDKVIAEAAGLKRVHVLHNPLFLSPLAQVPEKERVVLAVGRIDAWHCKGLDVLIKAWRAIADKHADWTLRIVGQGDEKSMAFLRGLSGDCPVEFGEYTSNIVDEYRRAAIFALSSRYEGWGLALTEAMSQRCACVACDYKGRQAEIITDGVDGLLCPPDDADALAECLDRLIGDDALRGRLQQHSADALARFTPAAVAARLHSIITSL